MIEPDAASTRPADYPVTVRVEPALEGRDRLTAFFRFFLALPHIILVGAPVAMATSVFYGSGGDEGWQVGSSGGLVSIVVVLAAFLAWLAILFTGRHPDAFWRLGAWYMRWRVRATAYMTLLRDEYPPFGDDPYPTALELDRPAPGRGPRNRLTVFFRLLLAVPHAFVLGFLGVAWAFTTAVAWAWILLTGRFPEPLYGFALGVLAWTTRVECYLLLLRDEYPPFSLRV